MAFFCYRAWKRACDSLGGTVKQLGVNEILGNRPATCPSVILNTLTDDSTVASVEMLDEDEDGPESRISDEMDGPELTSSRSATPVSRATTTVSSAAGIRSQGRNDL